MDSYSKIIRLSNTLYNIGLEKAKVRDLSGAADSLRKSLRFNKANILARNLLGLVYFEMGETVDALSEWVISRSLQPEDNIAEEYLTSIQSNRAKLNTINQTIKKYNQALLYCNQGSQDLAIIQLKKVLSLNPNLVKGHQLLALLYMQEGRFDQAKKELRAAGRIDANNTLTLRYLKEANIQLHGEQPSQKNSRKEKEEQIAYQSGNETIIQPAHFKDNSGLMTIINIVIGIVIGVAIAFFLIMPSIRQDATSEAKKAEVEANNNLTTKNQEIKGLESQMEDLNSQIADLQAKEEGAQQVTAAYDKLIEGYHAFVQGDVESAGNVLAEVDSELISESARAVYEEINGKVNEQYIASVFAKGESAYNSQNFEEAVTELEKVVQIEEDFDDGNAIYYLAQSYYRLEDKENAKKYFQRMVELHPRTERARKSQSYLDEMAEE